MKTRAKSYEVDDSVPNGSSMATNMTTVTTDSAGIATTAATALGANTTMVGGGGLASATSSPAQSEHGSVSSVGGATPESPDFSSITAQNIRQAAREQRSRVPLERDEESAVDPLLREVINSAVKVGQGELIKLLNEKLTILVPQLVQKTLEDTDFAQNTSRPTQTGNKANQEAERQTGSAFQSAEQWSQENGQPNPQSSPPQIPPLQASQFPPSQPPQYPPQQPQPIPPPQQYPPQQPQPIPPPQQYPPQQPQPIPPPQRYPPPQPQQIPQPQPQQYPPSQLYPTRWTQWEQPPTNNGPPQQVPPTAYAGYVVGRNYIDKWKLKFDGSAKSITAEDFIFRLEQLKEDYGCSDEEVLVKFPQLLEGAAEGWYWMQRRLGRLNSFQALKQSFLAQFRKFESDFDVQRKMMDRRQGSQEVFEDYYNAMLQLRHQQREPMEERMFIDMMKNNLKPSMASLIFPVKIYGLQHFREECRKAEQLLGYQRQATQINRQQYVPRVHSLEYGAPEEWEVDAISRQSNYLCWNCREKGHGFMNCPSATRNLFCYGCGLEKVAKPNCPRCQGNQQTGTAKGIARPAQPNPR
ncbi:uncharacterized protein [Musca autumnalis]|uniref:uncharacterized protein n=1 Tax=Musca autumnalis TaxID=221902 RepID=UPI003CEA1FCC